MKTELTLEDRDKVWRSGNTVWLHYAWRYGRWYTFPCDPRTNPMLTNFHVASGQKDGVLVRNHSGFVEVS